MKKIVRVSENDLTRIVKTVLNEQEEWWRLPKHILKTYVRQIEDGTDMDDFMDEFDYYDNIIDWAVEKYIEAEEPDKEDDWSYRAKLADNLKDYWMPI
jgi:hypothetical protein